MTGSGLETVNKISHSPVTDKPTEIRPVWDEGGLAGQGWSHGGIWPDMGSEDRMKTEGKGLSLKGGPKQRGQAVTSLSIFSHSSFPGARLGSCIAKAGHESQQPSHPEGRTRSGPCHLISTTTRKMGFS